ncbi:MAG: TonB-dependent receptor plug domain-containing protein [Bacteroidales bacterium]|nr:TonB-dependent receptor plug domain-containing protein [Bacteroidales bacterium]
MNKIFLSAIMLFVGISSVGAQNAEGVPFNGVISDFVGNAAKRAKVSVNDYYYTMTDRQGRFGLTDVKDTDTLKIKYQKSVYYIPVAGRKSIRIKLADQLDKSAMFEAAEDQELVDYGYGFVKRRESLNISNGIPGEVLRRRNTTNILDALSGMVPGLNLQNKSGKTKALIRGVGTIGKTDPLFIVDGVEVESLDYISVYDVERVEVLKDGSMYGVRGANGVIIVRTIGR